MASEPAASAAGSWSCAASTMDSARQPTGKPACVHFKPHYKNIKNELLLALSLGEESWAQESDSSWSAWCPINTVTVCLKTGKPFAFHARGTAASLPRRWAFATAREAPRKEGQPGPGAGGWAVLPCRVKDPRPGAGQCPLRPSCKDTRLPSEGGRKGQDGSRVPTPTALPGSEDRATWRRQVGYEQSPPSWFQAGVPLLRSTPQA